MNDFLSKIIEQKREEIKRKKFYFPLSKFIREIEKSTRNFRPALLKEGLSLIAEIKKASPSEGILNKNFDHISIARIYQNYASAVSIVTDERFFQGKLEYLADIDKISQLPLLRKDFIIDEYQIYESRYYGADAVLLISSLLKSSEINEFIKIAKSYHMHCVVEIHDLKELKKVLATEARIIGINNRDLESFKVDLNTTVQLAPHIPDGHLIIAESGITDLKDIEVMRENVNGILVGSAFMKSKNLEESLKKWSVACNEPIERNRRNKQLSIL